MHLLISLLLYSSLASVAVNGMEGPPNSFPVSFGRDLKTFGVRKCRVNSMKTNGDKQVEEVKTTNVNDFEEAEEMFFNTVENIEKAILHSAESLLHDEVDVLFGVDHGASLHKHDLTPKVSKKKSTQKKAVMDVNMKTGKEINNFDLSHFLEESTGIMFE